MFWTLAALSGTPCIGIESWDALTHPQSMGKKQAMVDFWYIYTTVCANVEPIFYTIIIMVTNILHNKMFDCHNFIVAVIIKILVATVMKKL